MFPNNGKCFGSAAKYAMGKQSLSNAVKENQLSKNLSQDGKSVCFSQTSQEDSSWETQTSNHKIRLDDAIARNRHSDIMSTLKGIESVLSKMSDSLMKMVLAIEDCARENVQQSDKNPSYEIQTRNSIKRKYDNAKGNHTSSSSDLFAVDMISNVKSTDSDADECQRLDNYLAKKRFKANLPDRKHDTEIANSSVKKLPASFTLNVKDEDSQATQLPPGYYYPYHY